jgi:hypothetical protein
MLTGDRSSVARFAALEVDDGLFRWSSRSEKKQTVIHVKRWRRW